MQESLNLTSGMVPAIQLLNDHLEKLFSFLQEAKKSCFNEEQRGKLEKSVQEIKEIYKDLPTTADRSYELIMMVIRSIHSSREELKKSVDGLLKKTGMQLQKVTSTTEEATNKILDVAERLDEEQNLIIDSLDELTDKIKNNADNEEIEKIIGGVKEKIYQNQDSAFTIMDYLQFQDITAQQIAGAYALLSDTEKTLVFVSEMLKSFDPNNQYSLEDIPVAEKDNSFNADASFDDKAKLQNAIDHLFADGDAAQKNVSDIFKDVDGAKTEVRKPATPAVPAAPANKKNAASQDDIDALFSGGTPAKKTESSQATQDEIDKLFSQ